MFKRKRQPDLPDRVLARAFAFDAHDLLANRAGWQTWAQLLGMPLIVRAALPQVLRRHLVRWSRSPVRRVVGRAHFDYWQRQHVGFFRLELQEFHTLDFGDPEERFFVSGAQQRTLTPGLRYEVYCLPDQPVILSLARLTASDAVAEEKPAQ